ncbi:MAG: redoxin domain-containing protein [Anaerolineae bacterium]|nr:redoxin domain-containing protein [Anaerolineae bacterium]
MEIFPPQLQNELPLHKPAPDFCLTDLQGKTHRLSDFRGKIVVINFWSAECPHSQRVDVELRKLAKSWGEAAIVVTVASNADETPEQIQQSAERQEIALLLHDREQVAANLFGARTTPHLFALDANGILRYRGAFDDVSFRQREPRRFYLAEAVAALLEGQIPKTCETNSFGCALVRFGRWV